MKTEQKWKICDCLDGLPEVSDNSIDMILTDMPYGITACSWDNNLKLCCLWDEYRRIIKDNGAIVLTAAQPFTSILVMSAPDLFKYELIWEKDSPTNPLVANIRIMPRHENILIFYKNQPPFYPQKNIRLSKNKRNNDMNYVCMTSTKGNTKVKRVTKATSSFCHPSSILFFNKRDRGLHPTQKPVELFEYLIKTYTNEGDTVHDSCLGSGTTLEACMNLNRNCIGFEIDPQWEPIYRKRLKLDNTKLDAFNTSAYRNEKNEVQERR